MKSSGFDIEKTHLQDIQRIEKLILLVMIAFVWCYKVGIYLHQINPITIKKHGRKAKSIFKYGLNFLAGILLNNENQDNTDIFQFLSCTQIANSNEETEGRTNEFYNVNYERFTILNTTLDENNKRLIGNLYYSYASDSLDTKFDAQINYATYNNTQDQITTNEYFNVSDNQQYRDPEIIRNDNPTKYNILSTRVDYEKELNDKFTLETGAKYSYVSNNYNNLLFERDVTTDFQLDVNRSNELEYKESMMLI